MTEPFSILVGTLAMLAPIGALYGLSVWARKSWARREGRMWVELGEALELDLEPGPAPERGAQPSPISGALRGEREGIAVAVRIAEVHRPAPLKESSRRTIIFYTHVEAKLPTPLEIGLCILPQGEGRGDFETVEEGEGGTTLHEVEAALDGAYRVSARAEAEAQHLMARAEVLSLLRAHVGSEFSLTISDDSVSLVRRGIVLDPAVVGSVVQSAQALAQALSAIGNQAEESELVGEFEPVEVPEKDATKSRLNITN